MSAYDSKKVRPNYVREWLQGRKETWRKMLDDKIVKSGMKGNVDAKTVIKEGKLTDIGLNASMDSAGKLSFGSDE